MAQVLRMPSEAELPRGPVRDFVKELFSLYKDARRPALRAISDAIRRREDLSGTASTETIRRMLRGITVPVQWQTVEAVLVVLCEMAGTDLDTPVEALIYNNQRDTSRREDVEHAWHRALDNPNGRKAQPPIDDPWASDAGSGGAFSDEPPF